MRAPGNQRRVTFHVGVVSHLVADEKQYLPAPFMRIKKLGASGVAFLQYVLGVRHFSRHWHCEEELNITRLFRIKFRVPTIEHQ